MTAAGAASAEPLPTEKTQAFLLHAQELEKEFELRIVELQKHREDLLQQACVTSGQITEAKFWLEAIRNSKPATGAGNAHTDQGLEPQQ